MKWLFFKLLSLPVALQSVAYAFYNVTIDDTDLAISFTGPSWVRDLDFGEYAVYNRSCSYSNAVTASVTFNFIGGLIFLVVTVVPG